MGMIETLGSQLGGQLAGSVMGMALQHANDRRQLEQQGKLQQLQIRGSKEMTDYNYAKQLQMWHDTNYSAQMEHLKKAGLNPGLIYGMSGGGATTTGSGSGSVSGANAPVGGGEIMGMMLGQAQIKLMEAQAKKTEVEAEKIGGVDTALANTQISSLTQGIEESKAKQALTEVQTELGEIDRNFRNDTYKASVKGLEYNVNKALQELEILRNEAKISGEVWQDKVQIIQGEAAGILLRNELLKYQGDNTQADTDLKRQTIQKIVQDMQSQLRELSQKDRSLSQEDQHIIIQKARNALIETGIWVGAGSKVIGDALDLVKPKLYKKDYKRD